MADTMELERLRGLREAMHTHCESMAAWTKEFQPGGAFDGVLRPGSDASVEGGLWLVSEVKRLRTALDMRNYERP
jgi:hypothetical protein